MKWPDRPEKTLIVGAAIGLTFLGLLVCHSHNDLLVARIAVVYGVFHFLWIVGFQSYLWWLDWWYAREKRRLREDWIAQWGEDPHNGHDFRVGKTHHETTH